MKNETPQESVARNVARMTREMRASIGRFADLETSEGMGYLAHGLAKVILESAKDIEAGQPRGIDHGVLVPMIVLATIGLEQHYRQCPCLETITCGAIDMNDDGVKH